MQSRAVSSGTLPIRVLGMYLGLTDAQKGNISEAREEVEESSSPAMGSGGFQRGQGGGQGNTQMQAAESKMSRAVEAVLTDEQRAKLTALVKGLQGLAAARIRPEAALKLQLTSDQLTQLAAVKEGNTAKDDVDAILSDTQRTVTKTYTMPEMRRGKFGGSGGGPNGGQGVQGVQDGPAAGNSFGS